MPPPTRLFAAFFLLLRCGSAALGDCPASGGAACGLAVLGEQQEASVSLLQHAAASRLRPQRDAQAQTRQPAAEPWRGPQRSRANESATVLLELLQTRHKGSRLAQELAKHVPNLMATLLLHPDVFEDLKYLGELDWDKSSNLELGAARLQHAFSVAPELQAYMELSLGRPDVVEATLDTGVLAPFFHDMVSTAASRHEMVTFLSTPSFMKEYSQALPDDGFQVFLKHSPTVRGQMKAFMRPTMRLSRDIGLVGNAVLILAIVLLTSAKSRSLSKQDPSQKLPSLEKVMRRDITASELAAHALPGDLWLAVDGMVCDITDFTQVHPGGADLLLEFAGKDVTEQFQEVGHSEFAMDLIRARLVGTLVEGGGEGGGPGASALLHGDGAGRGFFASLKGGAKKVLPAQVFALFTREDPYNLHKILGFAVIGHFFVRWGLAISGKWMEMGPLGDPMMFDTSVFSLASAWLCILLQVSSFQFVLPRNRVLGRPMLWQEWRAHNLIFVLRSLIAFTANWTCKRYVTTQNGRLAIDAVCFLTVFGQLYFADVASRALRDSKHESLTASWPLWDGCPVMVERFLKFYYSIGINQLTSMTLGCGEGGWMLMQTFCGVLILQTDSFAMTLVRKNIISTASFHGYYLWNMWALAFLGLHTFGVVAYRFIGREAFFYDLIMPMWGIPISVYIVRYLGLSKYGCWAGFMVRILAMEFTEWGRWCWLTPIPVWALWAFAQLLLSGYVFEYRVRRFLEGGRPKPLVLRSREKVSGSLYRLCFDMPAGYNCGMMPGQHMRVLAPNISKGKDTWNGQANLEKEASDLSRSYTPISSPDASTMEILVKHYPCDASCGCPQGGRVSTFLIDQLAVGGEVLASGPHGQRIYFGNGLFEVEVGKPKVRPRTVAFLAGGSGITPALSVMREMQVEAKRKESKVEAWRMMDYENEVGVTGFHVLHANRSSEDTLPLSLYAPKSSLIPVHVSNLATRAKLGSESMASDLQEEAGNKWELKYGEVTAEAVAAAFPQPSDDVLVILCGPHGFITNVCQPFVKKLGYKHVIAMW